MRAGKNLILLFTLNILTLFCAIAHDDIFFIENKGQWNPEILFKADIPGGKLFIEKNRFTYLFYDSKKLGEIQHKKNNDTLDCHSVFVNFINSNSNIIPEKGGKLDYYHNYYIGNDKSKWATGVGLYTSLVLRNFYNGIDLEIKSVGASVKFNFIVAPFANPADIQILYEGQDRIWLENNNLKILTSVNLFIERMPEVYQLIGEQKKMVKCRYQLNNNLLTFSFPKNLDNQYQLVIDPLIIFSSYSGSVADNFGYTATYDDSGYAYSGGTVFGLGFPVTKGAYQIVFKDGHVGDVWGSGDNRDIGILKYKPDGSSLVYATYLGGSGNEDPHSMVVDKNYNLVVFGNTSSVNFPIGNTFYDSSFNGNYDIILAKFSTDGKSLLSSTYVGGSNSDGLNGYFTGRKPNESILGFNYGDSYRGEVNINHKNQILVATTTKSSDFPVTSGAFQYSYGGGLQDAVVMKFSNGIDTLLKASFIGGNDDDAGYGIAINSANEYYVCGGTRSVNLKTIQGKYNTMYNGGVADGFVYYISDDFSTLKAATFIGTSQYDQVYFVQTDVKDNVYITGQTKSDFFPVKNVKYYRPKGKLFISKLNPGLDSLIYSTVFGNGGANPDLAPSAFLVDVCERVYFSGWGGKLNHDYSHNTGSYTTGLPVTPDAFQKSTDGSDFYVSVFSRDIQSLLFATFYGGNRSTDHVDGGTSRFDKKGVVYQSVCASCGGWDTDFPTSPSNVHSHYNLSNNCNNAVFKIDLNIPDLFADFSIDTIFCVADSTHIINKTIGGATYYWDFGIAKRSDDTSTAFQPRFRYTDTGVYKVTLIASNINSCDLFDTMFRYIRVYNQAEADFTFQNLACKNEIQFEASSKYGQNFKWNFGDNLSKNNFSTAKKPIHIFSDSGFYSVTLIVDSGTVCEYKVVKKIRIDTLPLAKISYNLDTCNGLVTFFNQSQRSSSSFWDYGDLSYSSNNQPKHTHKYATADSFHLLFIAMPNTVCADTAETDILITVQPATMVIKLDTCRHTASFIGISAYAKGMGIWNLGDGKDSMWTDTILNYKYQKAGNYIVLLVANYGTLCVDTVRRVMNIPELPVALFSDSTRLCHPDAMFFNHSLNASKYEWVFGNGQSSTQNDSVKTSYNNKGTYLVNLIAVSANNCRDTFTDTVRIIRMAIADFSVKWDSCTNKIKINNYSTKNTKHFWDFGNGITDTTQKKSFSKVIDTSGLYTDTFRIYTIKLLVKDSVCIDSAQNQVMIIHSPKPDFNVSYDSCQPIAIFSSKTKGAINIYWDLGDSTTSEKSNFIHKYKSKGNYSVMFYINKDTICTDSVSKSIYVGEYDPAKIDIPNVFTPGGDGVNEVYYLKNMNFKCDNYEFYVYNRWGQLVYKAINEPVVWNGKVNGIPLSAGTYYYVFKSSTTDKAGTITIIR